MNGKNRKNFHVLKSGGYTEKFSRNKLTRSILNSGLSQRESYHIADKVYQKMVEGLKTKKIYDETLRLLKHRSFVAAVHYSLKRSLFHLGPAGYHFELFAAKYFAELGYQTKTGKVLRGLYVNHEVDVIGKKEENLIFAECKFHNHIGIKNDIKTALYVKARWDDLREGPDGKNLEKFFLITNTSFSLDALTYANGTGLQLLGTNAPTENNFLKQIEKLKLYPITGLSRLNKIQKAQLLNEGIITVKDILKHEDSLYRLGLSKSEVRLVLDDIYILTKV